ncbi:MAG: DHH family phosphoesterase [Methanomicrobiaceae archaeon]|nr:DHH family phosphoesterase [Methanomicrobiaceae archaeon]
MSIESAADHIADKLSESDHLRVYGHHDADGIASATIMCHALNRIGKKFHLTIKDRISNEDIKKDEVTLLCDFGASLEDLPEDVMVVDHHIPCFNGEYHANPRLCGIDGEKELSASGVAYIVANHMGDNRDLSGLALLGIIGDRQAIAGKNQEIINEGIANQFIVPERGIPLAGRNLEEKLFTAINPYLRGISGEKEAVQEILKRSLKEQEYSYETLLSEIILKIAPETNDKVMQSLWGDRYELERGVITDAHSMAAVVESCGLSKRGGLGVTLCLRTSQSVEEAWDIAIKHRLKVISAIQNVKSIDESISLFEVSDPTTASSVADSLAYDNLNEKPVFVMVKSGEKYSVSARCPSGAEYNLSEIMKNIAEEAGGTGGGHISRAGATFEKEGLLKFKNGLKEAFA